MSRMDTKDSKILFGSMFAGFSCYTIWYGSEITYIHLLHVKNTLFRVLCTIYEYTYLYGTNQVDLKITKA